MSQIKIDIIIDIYIIIIDNMDYSMKDEDNNFIHFNRKNDLKNFMKLNKNLHYGHVCCKGLGVLIHNKKNSEINNMS